MSSWSGTKVGQVHPGIRWMRRYFREQPQLNAKAASESYKAAKNLLKQEPFIGHVFDEIEGVFEKEISKTRFSIIYAVKDETVLLLIFAAIAVFVAAMRYISIHSTLRKNMACRGLVFSVINAHPVINVISVKLIMRPQHNLRIPIYRNIC